MPYTLRLYWSYMKTQVLINLEYRVNLLFGVLGVAILNVVDIALIGLILARFGHIGGWTFWEIVFLAFFYLLVLGIENMFAVQLLDIEDYIRDGRFDRFLVRPVPALVQVLFQELNLRYIDHLILGTVGMSLAYSQLGLQWGVAEAVFFAASLVSAALLLGAIVLGLSSLAFWTVRSSPFVFATMEIQETIQRYPLSIFPNSFILAMTFVLPFAFLNYYPSLVLLNKTSEALVWWLPYLTPLVAGLFSILSYTLWKAGVRHYQSTGS